MRLMTHPLEEIAPLVDVFPVRASAELLRIVGAFLAAHEDDHRVAVITLDPLDSRRWRWSCRRRTHHVGALALRLCRCCRARGLVLPAFLQDLVDGVLKLVQVLLVELLGHAIDLAGLNVHRIGHTYVVQDHLAKGGPG